MSEFGGYLPLELKKGREWYTEDRAGLGVARLNSGRTALWTAFRHLGAKRVFYPRYYCPSVVESLRRDGFEMVPYPVGFDLLPCLDGVSLGEGDALLLVDYFGLVGAALANAVERYPRVVMDNALAFFSPPTDRDGVVSVYSCRKFFGVSDGAYAIGRGVSQPDLPRDHSSLHAAHLLKSIEFGTNEGYNLSLENERQLGLRHLAMSELTLRILDSIDYEGVRHRRRQNFWALGAALGAVQQLGIGLGDACVPSCYPLLTDRPLRTRLVEKRVYVPRMWETWIDNPQADPESVEYQFSNNLVCLPVDQRYDDGDMARLADIVYRILEGSDD